MLRNSVLIGAAPKGDLGRWCDVIKLVHQFMGYAENLPEKVGITYNCHSVCRAIVATIPGLKLVDGRVVGMDLKTTKDSKTIGKCTFHGCDHSWLVTRKGSIIDPYPVGFITANPIIVVNSRYNFFFRSLYIPDPAITKKINTPEMRREVVALKGLIRKSKNQGSSLP